MNKKFRIEKSKSTKCKMELSMVGISLCSFSARAFFVYEWRGVQTREIEEGKKWMLRKCQRQYLLKTFFDRFTSVRI